MVLLSNFVAMQPTKPGPNDVPHSSGNRTFDGGQSDTELLERSGYLSDVKINGYGEDARYRSQQQGRDFRRGRSEPPEDLRAWQNRYNATFPSQNENHGYHHPHNQPRRRHSLQQDNQQYPLTDSPQYSIKTHRPSSQSKSQSSRQDFTRMYDKHRNFERDVYTKMSSSNVSTWRLGGRKNGYVANDSDPTYMTMTSPNSRRQDHGEKPRRYSNQQVRLLGGSSDKSYSTHADKDESPKMDNANLQSQPCNSVNSGLPSHYPSDALIDAGMHNSQKKPLVSQIGRWSEEDLGQSEQMETTFFSPEPSLMTRSADFSSMRSGSWFHDEEQHSRTRTKYSENGQSVSGKSKKRLPAPLDISLTSTVSNAQSWSPNYMKMKYLFGRVDGDSVPHSKPRSYGDSTNRSKSHGQMWRSATESDFRQMSVSRISRSKMNVDNGHVERSRANSHNHRHGQAWDQSAMTRSLDFSSLSLNNGYDDEMSIHHAKVFTPTRSNPQSRHSMADSRMTSSAHEGLSDSFSSYGTMPRRGSGGIHNLRRSVSHDSSEIKVKPLVVRTSSEGEVESEYVTLDWRYHPSNGSHSNKLSTISPESILSNSVLCPPPDENMLSSEYCQRCESDVASCQCQINRIRKNVLTNQDSNVKNDTSLLNTPDSILVKPNLSMSNQLQTNTLPAKSKRSFLRKRSSSTLQTVEEADSVSSSSMQSSTGSGRAPLPNVSRTLTHNKISHHTSNTNSNHNGNNSNGLNDKSYITKHQTKSLHHDNSASKTSQNKQHMQQHQQEEQQQNPNHNQPDPAQPAKLTRSKSLSDLQVPKKPTKSVNSKNNQSKDNTNNNTNYSDDEDGDDFGFLSYPLSFSSSFYSPSTSTSTSTSTAMQKAKSPSPSSRILPKRWRSKNKAVPVVASSTAMWTPGPAGSCVWSSVSGRKVHLRPVSLLTISEAERLALQKIALSTLQNMALECPVVIPKDGTDVRRSKKSALSLKRRSKSLSGSNQDANSKETASLVFGIPLSKCILNDRELEKKRRKVTASTPSSGGAQNAVTSSPSSPMVVKMRTESADNLLTPRAARKSSSSSQGSLENSHGHNGAQNGTVTPHRQDTLAAPSHKRAASTDSLSESESSRNTSSSLIDALSLSTSHPASRINSIAVDRSLTANHGELQVPYVVKTCFRHIETYGLHTLGVFRVGCSKKRVKQLREEFDSGKDVELNEEYHPHDVAALLKEYFRDLPEPLLTRDLYLPFLYARRLPEEHKRSTAFSLLISMLPVVNRDTLWALLRFLGTVSQHAPDSTNDKGETISGNKMDTHNLATLFGPNVLHRTKSALDKEGSAESAESVEQSKEVIEVVKDMIDKHHELYEISGSLRDDVLRLLIESDQETADRILKHLANQNQIEVDPESMSSVFEDVTGSPVLSHAMNSDADFFAYTKRQSTTAQRPLRVTKSVEDCLDSPVSKSRATHLSDSQVLSESEAMKMSGSHTHPRLDLGHSYPSPLPSRVPILRLPHDSSTSPEVVLRGRLEAGGGERPYSEGYSQNLSIPRPLYLRENSNSSVSSCLSSSQNSHGGSDGNNHSGQWVLPTPPASRGSSPKPFFRSASSSSTLIATSSPSRFNHSHSEEDERIEKNMPHRNVEWERERWRQWEMIASEKRNSEAEQETLV